MTAIVEMIFTGSTAVPADALRSESLDWIERLTPADYSQIVAPDPRTFYVITP